jgi:hypothetical protein
LWSCELGDQRAANQAAERALALSESDPLAGLSAQERRILELIGGGADQPADR